MINPNLKIDGYSLVRLCDEHQLLPFDCGDSDLNEFFEKEAKVFQESLLAVTYVLEDRENNRTVAFFSLLNDCISAEQFDSNRQFMKRIKSVFTAHKQFKDYPAIKIGRFGVSAPYQRKALGSKIISILKVLFVLENRTGCRYITVDAYADALKFYKNQEFEYFTEKDAQSDTRQMYYDLFIAKANTDIAASKALLLPKFQAA